MTDSLEDEHELRGVYPAAGTLLGTLFKKSEQAARVRHEDVSKIKKYLRGDRSQLIVFCLYAKKLTGTPSDEFTVLPASPKRRWGTINAEVNDQFNFTVHHRQSSLEIPALVRTGSMSQHDYDPQVAVISVANLASAYGIPQQMRELERAIIADVGGRASASQLDHIQQATERLELIFLTKLVELSERQKTA